MFSLVVPTYNEKANIKSLLDAVTFSLRGFDYEVLVVDDDSPDGTALEALDYAASNKRVRVLVRREERGLSSAVVAGFKRARGDVLGVMDADLSHDPELLPEMVLKVRGGFDMAIGTRVGVRGWGLKRKLISAGGKLLAKLFLHVSINDPMSGFFVIHRDVFERVRDELNPLGFKIMLELYYRARPLRVAEIPYVFVDRVAGESKVMGNITDFLRQLRSLRSSG